MLEMDQYNNQIATMMEALKLLTCDMTVDLEQTQICGSESINKEAESEMQQLSNRHHHAEESFAPQHHNFTIINGCAIGRASSKNAKS